VSGRDATSTGGAGDDVAGAPRDVPSGSPGGVPWIMGVLNATPDSFSDGGRYLDPGRAVAHGLAMLEDGADLLDVGGESTRPGAEPVAEAEELARVLPVVEGLRAAAPDARISIDTMKSGVARAALAAGATLVNDVSAGLADPDMLGVVAAHPGASIALMHRQGDSRTMQVDPRYGDPLAEVLRHLADRVAAAEAAGVPADRILVDPGIGFGKRLEHNLALLARLGELRALGRPILLGVSRKAFIAHITGAERPADYRGRTRSDAPADRIGGTAAAVALAAAAGDADVLRVHDVRVMREAMLVARAIAGARP